MKHKIPADLLRQLTLSSCVMRPQDLIGHALIDALSGRDRIAEDAVAAARELASQPAFEVVRQQVRGGLAAALRALADAESDPILSSFG